MSLANKQLLILGGVAAAAVLYVSVKGVSGAAQAAVGVVGDAAAGTVIGIGEQVGIPETNLDQCQIDLANGDTLKASFSCPASVFLKSTLGF